MWSPGGIENPDRYHIQSTFNENDYTSVTPISVFIAKHIYNDVNNSVTLKIQTNTISSS